MISAKNPRVQELSGESSGGVSALNSPLKRRSNFVLPANVTNSFVDANQTINDDEAERRKSRRFETSINEESTGNLAEAADSLHTGLKLFAENKINKDNAWSINIIDSFAKLIQKHHSVLSNFQMAGTTLEASAKVYGLRVDSVYTDVVRMTANLARQSAKALTTKGTRGIDEDDDSDHDQDQGMDKENLDASNQPNNEQKTKAKKVVKKRKTASTITKNPDTLNARLETNPLTDPFFAKLNSVIGDTNSSKRLMQNIIPTEESKLKLRQNMPIWNLNDQPVLDLDMKTNYLQKDPSLRVFSVIPTYNIANVSKLFVRQGLSTYRLTNEPMEKYDEPENSFRFDDEFNNTVLNKSNHIDLQFDINAEVEPVAFDKSVVMDFGEMDHDDFEDLNEMDQIAVNRCKGLRRQAVIIEDMQPETCANLEYSYRPLDIDQFWAGPSHWKFRQSRRTTALGLSAVRGSGVNTSGRTSGGVVEPRNKIVRKRKIIKKLEATHEDFANVEQEITGNITKITSRIKGTQLSNQTIAKKWDTKKHKLPDDFKVPLDVFDKFVQATSIHINSNLDVTFTGADDDDAIGYDYNNENDRDYCSRLNDDQSDTETGTNTDMGQMDNMEFDNLEMQPPAAPLIDEIPDVFVGAPERIEKISIAFARRAKVVDMKQLKTCSWNLLNLKHNNDMEHNPKFSDTLKDLPKVLSRTMAENMSMPLAFYAILHLCNDKSLLLHQNDENLKDFDIEFLKNEL